MRVQTPTPPAGGGEGGGARHCIPTLNCLPEMVNKDEYIYTQTYTTSRGPNEHLKLDIRLWLVA